MSDNIVQLNEDIIKSKSRIWYAVDAKMGIFEEIFKKRHGSIFIEEKML